jgi:hypothetical protein
VRNRLDRIALVSAHASFQWRNKGFPPSGSIPEYHWQAEGHGGALIVPPGWLFLLRQARHLTPSALERKLAAREKTVTLGFAPGLSWRTENTAQGVDSRMNGVQVAPTRAEG